MNRLPVVAFFAVVIGYIAASSHIGSCQTTRAVHESNSAGAQSYTKHCAICHGEQREGILPGFPPLVEVSRRYTPQQIEGLIRTGKGRMPSFSKLSQEEVASLLRFLSTDNFVADTSG